jgi:hypothetical protein
MYPRQNVCCHMCERMSIAHAVFREYIDWRKKRINIVRTDELMDMNTTERDEYTESKSRLSTCTFTMYNNFWVVTWTIKSRWCCSWCAVILFTRVKRKVFKFFCVFIRGFTLYTLFQDDDVRTLGGYSWRHSEWTMLYQHGCESQRLHSYGYINGISAEMCTARWNACPCCGSVADNRS